MQGRLSLGENEMAKPAKPFNESIPVGDNNSVKIQSRDSINIGHLKRIPWWGRGTCIILLMIAIYACSLINEDVNQQDLTNNSYHTESPSETIISKIIIDKVPKDQGESLCDSYQPTLITDLEVRQIIPLEAPPARIEFLDPVFDTCLVRVTDHSEIIDPERIGLPGHHHEGLR